MVVRMIYLYIHRHHLLFSHCLLEWTEKHHLGGTGGSGSLAGEVGAIPSVHWPHFLPRHQSVGGLGPSTRVLMVVLAPVCTKNHCMVVVLPPVSTPLEGLGLICHTHPPWLQINFKVLIFGTLPSFLGVNNTCPKYGIIISYDTQWPWTLFCAYIISGISPATFALIAITSKIKHTFLIW